MGDRTVVRFVSGSPELEATACVYVHGGGPPSEMQFLFSDFFMKIEQTAALDTRYSDPSYLAARFVSFVAMYSYDDDDGEQFGLDFTGVGILPDDPMKAAEQGHWLYTVICNGSKTVVRTAIKKRPEVVFHDVMLMRDDDDPSKNEVVWQRYVPMSEASDNYTE